MAVTIMGGLLLGTLITLGMVPVLYELLFSDRLSGWSRKFFGSGAVDAPGRLKRVA